MTIRQRLHRLWYGEENSHQANLKYHLEGMTLQQRAFVASLINPDPARVWGPDTSQWDGNVTLSVTKQKGASFVFIKGLDGTLTVRYFVENRQRAIDAGLLHSPYQWLYRAANVSCIAQAQAMTNLLQRYPPTMEPIIDFEWTTWSGAASNPNYSDLRTYLTEYTRLGNPKPLLYTAPGYLSLWGSFPADLRGMLAGLHIAHYGVTTPTVPSGFQDWVFWQFTPSGDATVYTPNDVNTREVDLNYFRNDLDAFNARYGVTPPPPVEDFFIHHLPDGTTKKYVAQ